MSRQTLNLVADRFLRSEKPEVMVIKGRWGVGKTKTWSDRLVQNKDYTALRKYSYVSLFGVTSINDLRTEIFLKTQPIELLEKKLNLTTAINHPVSYIKQRAKSLYALGTKLLEDIPYSKNITIGFEHLAPTFTTETIICFDDFERLSKEIHVDEILGLISELKEEKSCKIVLIFNEEKLTDPTTYATYREKVVDIEIFFNPTTAEAMSIGFTKDLPNSETVKKHCDILGIRNIRVLRKIEDLIKLLEVGTRTLHSNVFMQCCHTAVLLAWCYFEVGPDTPSIQFLKEWNKVYHDLAKREEDPIENQNWINTLNALDFYDMDELDLSILKIIECGFMEETGFIDAANKAHATQESKDLDDSFSKAWDLYHHTLIDNSDELIGAIITSFKSSISQISPMNLSGTTMLLRDLGKADEANELIDLYIDEYIKLDRSLDLKRYGFSSEIADPEIWKKFEEKGKVTLAKIPFNEFADKIANREDLSEAERYSIKYIAEDELYQFFLEENDERLSRLIANSLNFINFSDEGKIFATNVRNALTRIANEIPLSARRLRRFGISP